MSKKLKKLNSKNNNISLEKQIKREELNAALVDA
jgi:hypothetical protein